MDGGGGGGGIEEVEGNPVDLVALEGTQEGTFGERAAGPPLAEVQAVPENPRKGAFFG